MRGDKVRVRLSGECRRVMESEDQADWEPNRWHEIPEFHEPGHPSFEDGLTGYVAGIHGENVHIPIRGTADFIRLTPVPEDRLLGHYYLVEFDIPPRIRGLVLWCDTFAAIELNPI